MTQYSIVKGVFDILPHSQGEEYGWRLSHLWSFVEEVVREVTRAYQFFEVRTPIFEREELFKRSVGEGSDIVTKEMYLLEDKGGRKLALRPEGTAPVMRAFIEKHLDQRAGVQKLFYIGPMFRYERPQSGRYRQHHQFGVESIGGPGPEHDAEVIDLLLELYRRLGLKDLRVQLNSVGDAETRNKYQVALKAFLKPNLENLSEESQARFQNNILRILDSKNKGDRALLEKAPLITDYLSESAKDHFEKVQRLLKGLGLPFNLDPHLVRGLDYYNHTVFEVTAGELGAQNAIGAGGRYDGLIAQLGGADLPAVGFATGLERIIQTMVGQGVALPEAPCPALFMIPLGEDAKERCLTIACRLRHSGIPVEIELTGRKLKSALQLGDQMRASFVAIIGENELAKGRIALKEMEARTEHELSFDDLQPFLIGQKS
ncbi:MAG: Histidine--tRNA ligase [Chlamydiae bacterium]|nr:Histidine--tRNA ligase [Chlamydiota bacterium]